MKNKTLLSIFLCIIVFSALSAQASFRKTLEDDLIVITDMSEKEGLVIKLEKLIDGTVDTITVCTSTNNRSNLIRVSPCRAIGIVNTHTITDNHWISFIYPDFGNGSFRNPP